MFGAAAEMVLVGVAFGEEPGGVLGGQVELEQPVVLLAAGGGGDGLQVGPEPGRRPGYRAGPGSPGPRRCRH